MKFDQKILPEQTGGYKGYLLLNGEVVKVTETYNSVIETTNALRSLLKPLLALKADSQTILQYLNAQKQESKPQEKIVETSDPTPLKASTPKKTFYTPSKAPKCCGRG